MQVVIRALFRVAAALSVLVTLHLATRFFGAPQWGIYVTANAVIVLFGVLEDLGLETVIAREIAADQREGDALFTSSLFLRLALSLTAMAAAIAVTVAIFPGRTTLLITVVALAPTLAADAAQSASASLFQSCSRLGLVGVAELLASIVGIPAAIVCERLHLTIEAFALIIACGSLLAGLIAIGIATRFATIERFAARKWRWRKILHLTLPFGVVLLISTTYAQIDTVIVAAMKPAEEVAFYGVATIIVQMVASGPSFFMAALLPELATASGSSFDEAVLWATRSLLLWFAPLLVAAALLAPMLVDLVAGTRFHDATTPLVVLLSGTVLTLPTAALGNTLVARGEERRLLPIGVVVLIANVSLNLALVPTFGITGASVALVSSEAIALVLTHRAFRRLHGSPFRVALIGELAALVSAPAIAWGLLVPTGAASSQVLLRLIEVGSLMSVLVAGVQFRFSRQRRSGGVVTS